MVLQLWCRSQSLYSLHDRGSYLVQYAATAERALHTRQGLQTFRCDLFVATVADVDHVNYQSASPIDSI